MALVGLYQCAYLVMLAHPGTGTDVELGCMHGLWIAVSKCVDTD